MSRQFLVGFAGERRPNAYTTFLGTVDKQPATTHKPTQSTKLHQTLVALWRDQEEILKLHLGISLSRRDSRVGMRLEEGDGAEGDLESGEVYTETHYAGCQQRGL